MENIQSVAVYCGARIGYADIYQKAALELADYLADHDIRLVNGGGSIGLMGVMADRVLEKGGEAFGVIPLGLKEKEVAHLGMTELIVVPDMHSRKQTIVNLSDAFIAIPGGFGTLDELFETLTWAQLHLHNKPIGLLNVNGYFNALVGMIDHMVAEGFVKPAARKLVNVSNDVSELFMLLGMNEEYKDVKW